MSTLAIGSAERADKSRLELARTALQLELKTLQDKFLQDCMRWTGDRWKPELLSLTTNLKNCINDMEVLRREYDQGRKSASIRAAPAEGVSRPIARNLTCREHVDMLLKVGRYFEGKSGDLYAVILTYAILDLSLDRIV